MLHARNREALCLYAWHPYMYNPQLPRWLGRISGADPVAVGRQRPGGHARITAAPMAS